MNDLKECNTEELRPFINRPLSSVRKKQLSIFVLGVFLIVLVSACANVDPMPFAKFNTVAKGITAIDTAIDSHVSDVKERDMVDISNKKDAIIILALSLDPDDPFKCGYKYEGLVKEPQFIKLQRFDSYFTELNSAFIEYTSLLETLSGGDLIKTEDFDKLATDLNDNLRSALKSVGNEADASRLAMFSTIASTAAHAYISNKRKEYLIDILDDNQETVDGIIIHARNAVQIMRDEIWNEYLDTKRALGKKHAASENKRLIADEALANSDKTMAVFAMLKALDATYDSLGKTHRRLYTGLQSNKLPSFSDLRSAIKNLQKRHKDLKKANEKADKAEKAAKGTPS